MRAEADLDRALGEAIALGDEQCGQTRSGTWPSCGSSKHARTTPPNSRTRARMRPSDAA